MNGFRESEFDEALISFLEELDFESMSELDKKLIYSQALIQNSSSKKAQKIIADWLQQNEMKLRTWRELPKEKKNELRINISHKLQIKSKDSPRPSQTESAKNLEFITRQDSKIQRQAIQNDPESQAILEK